MSKIRMLTATLVLTLGSMMAFCQSASPIPDKPTGETGQAPSQSPSKPAQTESSKPAAGTAAKTAQPIIASKIPSGSKIYVAPMGGFENYVIAGILKKKVPVSLVTDREKADYEIKGTAETEKAGWAKMLFLNSQNSNEQASINVSEIKTGNVVFGYSVNKINSVRGKQSAGEAIGKHLNEAIGKD